LIAMEEKKYPILRKIFFWLFSLGFIIFAPIVLFYSLGYKFDMHLKKFQRTGAISIKTTPQQVEVYLDGRKISESTPYVIRELLPQKYTLSLEKEGFYPYKIPVEVQSSHVYDVDIVLLPKMENIEKINLDFNVYKFFVIRHIFSKRIIVFTDKGIYLLDEKFENSQKIATLNIDGPTINTIEGLEEDKNQLIFWNKNNIWRVKISQSHGEVYNTASLIYSTNELIKDVFVALKGRYLIIQEGMKIVILDIVNYSAFFPILELKSTAAKIFYDSESETLFLKDSLPSTDKSSLFKINLMEYIYERRTD